MARDSDDNLQRDSSAMPDDAMTTDADRTRIVPGFGDSLPKAAAATDDAAEGTQTAFRQVGRYQIIERNEKHVQAIARALKKSKALYLATDPDREGEAIAWHLSELLRESGDLDGKDVHRVVFYEITRNSVRQARLQLRLAQVQQSAACNALHEAESRFCRWLLQSRDRSDGDIVPITQEFLAQMLGVRRTTVTLVAQSLQDAGLLRYRRGRIEILDRNMLEERACECYGVVRRTIEQHLPAAER